LFLIASSICLKGITTKTGPKISSFKIGLEGSGFVIIVGGINFCSLFEFSTPPTRIFPFEVRIKLVIRSQ